MQTDTEDEWEEEDNPRLKDREESQELEERQKESVEAPTVVPQPLYPLLEEFRLPPTPPLPHLPSPPPSVTAREHSPPLSQVRRNNPLLPEARTSFGKA